jgi:hypothetical protein
MWQNLRLCRACEKTELWILPTKWHVNIGYRHMCIYTKLWWLRTISRNMSLVIVIQLTVDCVNWNIIPLQTAFFFRMVEEFSSFSETSFSWFMRLTPLNNEYRLFHGLGLSDRSVWVWFPAEWGVSVSTISRLAVGSPIFLSGGYRGRFFFALKRPGPDAHYSHWSVT